MGPSDLTSTPPPSTGETDQPPDSSPLPSPLSPSSTPELMKLLDDLAMAASRIAAGDHDRRAEAGGSGELDGLADGFNQKIEQLRELIHSLEQGVEGRARALQRWALLLETSTRVSKEIASILNIDDLLSRLEGLIIDAFGYYHVYIYLYDPDNDQLVIASNSSPYSSARKIHPVDENSLNGLAVRTRRLVLAGDVLQNRHFLYDANIPEVRSELVIPLIIGNRVIGTLDVSSKETDAFSPEDVQMISGVGDQIAVAIENARLYEQSQKLAALEERTRLARELHDSVAQSLSGIELRAKAAETYLKRSHPLAEVEIAELRRSAQDALQEMRALIYNLRPVSLEEGGLVEVLKREVQNNTHQDGATITLHAPEEMKLNAELERCLFRVAQETLRNALKHAHAGHIDVWLEKDSSRVYLTIKDDGRGFDPSAVPSGYHSFGIIGMKERVELLRGVFRLSSRPGTGTSVEVSLPLV